MGTFAQLAAGIPYGHRVMFALSIEGVEPIFTEYEVGKGVTNRSEGAGLLILDGSAAIGSKIDRRTGIGAGFDLGVTIRRGSAIDSLVNAPSVVTRLTADLDYTDTTVTVEDTTGFPASGVVYIGREAIEYSSTTATTFTVNTRGIYGPKAFGDARAYTWPVASSVSTWVTDRPLYWRGREAVLWAVPVDPLGACHSSDLLADAAMVWRGFIASDVETGRDGYTFACRSHDRKLAEPLVAGATGQARIRLQDDTPFTVQPSATIAVELYQSSSYFGAGSNELLQFEIQPFTGYTLGDVIPVSIARKAIADTVNAHPAITGSTYFADGCRWEPWDTALASGGVRREWRLMFYVKGIDATPSKNLVQSRFELLTGYLPPFRDVSYEVDALGIPQSPGGRYVYSKFRCLVATALSGFEVSIDGGDAADVPDSGWVLLEVGPDEVTYEYTDASQAGAAVEIAIDPESGPALEELTFENLSDKLDPITCRFAYRDNGSYADLMRRMLLSSGRGNNDATYDTLPAGAGYDLADVDTASFSSVLDGTWLYLVGDLTLDESTSFEDLFGGLLALSGRAIVARPNAQGDAVELAIVRTSLYDTADVAATITDAELVRASSGTSPVRRLDRVRMPNAVSAENETGGSKFSVAVNDVSSQRAEGREEWTLQTQGLARAALDPAVRTWAKTLFADRFGMQAYELDVAPWVDVRTGDSIALNLSHFGTWDRAAGAIGYNGTARVIGRRVALKTGVQTLTLLTAGRVKSMSLSPAAPVLAVDNPTAPTLVTVSDEYLGLLTAFDGEAGTFDMVCYLPSASSTGAGYSRLTCSAIVHDAANNEVDITVDSYTSSPNITTAWYLTTPLAATANAKQNQHLRTDSDAYWR
ncbi:MAG: hypothetical protein ACYTFV_02580 [Planctomycetota bacterium]|jgi:hypothetical protein